MQNNNKPKVSICCVTYNQKDYIKQTLDGFLMQKTNFPFIIIVGDDCSTDGTTEIIKEYADKYPDIIKPIYHNTNQKMYNNSCDVYNAVDSEYVALCEGDDYWIDENKLQLQIDLLDKNRDCNICFHKTRNIFENKLQKDYIFPTKDVIPFKKRFTFNDLLKKNFIQTNSCVYRCQYNNVDIRTVFKENIMPGDWFLHLLHANKGDILFIDRVMSVYRINANGIWYDSYKNKEKLYIKNGLKMLRFIKEVETIFNLDSNYIQNIHKDLITDIILTYCINFKIEEMKIIEQEFPEYIFLCKNTFTEKNNKLNKKLKKYRHIYQAFMYVSIFLIIVLIIFFIMKGII